MQQQADPLSKPHKQQKKSASSSAFYDTQKLKEIPILAVCDHLNIPYEKPRQGKARCKIRNERTASAVLDLEKNIFYDYGGGGYGGDVITLYACVAGVSQGEAMKALGQAFGILPENLHAGMDTHDLTNYEWEAIGLYGDRASKNFSLDGLRMPIDRLWEISQKYSMPMNQLRKDHPKTYARVLKQKALPYVRSLCTEYYLLIYGQYRLCRELGNADLFSSDFIQKELSQSQCKLERAEHLLLRALHGTDLSYECCKSYAPDVLLKKLLHGDLLGSFTYKGIQTLAKKKGCKVEYRSLNYMDYASSALIDLPHSAFLRGDSVCIGFLSSDKEKVMTILADFRLEIELPAQRENPDHQIKKTSPTFER